jgi:predicted nucleic-acid-binding protein
MKTQLDNLIRFVLNNHINMDQHLIDNDPSYIMEKWNKYIGVKPKKNKELPSYKTLKHILVSEVMNSENIEVRNWILKWNVNEKTYNEIKEIVYFIIEINKKNFRVHNRCIPSDIVTLFQENIGSFEDINKYHGGNLHAIIENFLVNWLSDTQVTRDYNLVLLV